MAGIQGPQARSLVGQGVAISVGVVVVYVLVPMLIFTSSPAGTGVYLLFQALFVGVWLAQVVADIWMIVDVSRRPDDQWQRIGRSKTAWTVFPALGLVCGFLGIAAPILYWTQVRPDLERNKYAAPPAFKLWQS